VSLEAERWGRPGDQAAGVGPALHPAHSRRSGIQVGMGEALTLQEAVDEAGAPLQREKAWDPGGEGQQGQHGSQDPAPAAS
jgi:hypothetical protein